MSRDSTCCFQTWLSSCNLSVYAKAVETQWTVLFVTSYRNTLLLELSLQLPPLCFPPLHGKMERKELCFHVISLSSCDLSVAQCHLGGSGLLYHTLLLLVILCDGHQSQSFLTFIELECSLF
jgi:hypothetical protein